MCSRVSFQAYASHVLGHMGDDKGLSPYDIILALDQDIGAINNGGNKRKAWVWWQYVHSIYARDMLRKDIGLQCHKVTKIFTGLMYKFILSFMVISDIYRSLIQNKATFTKYCLTQWISKLPQSFDKFYGFGGHSKCNCLQDSQFSQVLGKANYPNV